MKHELKSWPKYFREILAGHKSFEIRQNDRDFQVGDRMTLMEYDSETPLDADAPNDLVCYSGRSIEARITYVTAFQQKTGFVVMQLEILGIKEE